MSVLEDRFKFKAIHPVLNEAMEVTNIDFVKGTIEFGDGDVFLIAGKDGAYDEIQLEQSTGLKNKNGTLLFNNDMVTLNEDTCEIRLYEHGYSLFNFRTLQCLKLTSARAKQVEVVTKN